MKHIQLTFTTVWIIIIGLLLCFVGIFYVYDQSTRVRHENIRLEERIRAKEGIIDALVGEQDYSYKLYLTDAGIEIWNGNYLVTELDSVEVGKLYPILLKDNE